MQSVPEADFPFLGRTSGVTTSFIICVWMLLPIANSRDVETLFSSGIEASVMAAVSILTISDISECDRPDNRRAVGVLAAILPFVIPERLMQLKHC